MRKKILNGGSLKKTKPKRGNWRRRNLSFSTEFECEVDLVKEKSTLNCGKKI